MLDSGTAFRLDGAKCSTATPCTNGRANEEFHIDTRFICRPESIVNRVKTAIRRVAGDLRRASIDVLLRFARSRARHLRLLTGA